MSNAENTPLNDIWVYLSASPLLGLTLTMIAYTLSTKLYAKSNNNPLLNPVAISIATIIGVLVLTGTPYETYFDGAQYIHFLLGPATVALAVPLYQQIEKLRVLWLPIIVSIAGGLIVGAMSSVFIARYLGADIDTLLSLAPKSVTAPVAMGIAEKIGGIPSLTAAFVIVTGVAGSLLCTPLFTLGGVKDNSVKGIALGVSAHGIGTARAFQLNQAMGAFSGLAMALSALVATLVLPTLVTG